MTCRLTSRGTAVAWTRRRFGCLALFGLIDPVVAGTAKLAELDDRAVRMVVEAQLDAFAADDAERAFSYASKGIRAQFADAATFMAMVRNGYPMVVRPAAVSFLQAQVTDEAGGTVLQRLHLRDRAGRLSRADYLLERQAGGGWLISGCVVVAGSAQYST